MLNVKQNARVLNVFRMVFLKPEIEIVNKILCLCRAIVDSRRIGSNAVSSWFCGMNNCMITKANSVAKSGMDIILMSCLELSRKKATSVQKSLEKTYRDKNTLYKLECNETVVTNMYGKYRK